MTPSVSLYHLAHGSATDAEFRRQLVLVALAAFVAAANLAHLVFRQLCVSMLRASEPALGLGSASVAFSSRCALGLRQGTLTPLAQHIRCVIRLRPEKQMSRVAAGRIVAFVQNAKPVRDRAFCQNPSRPVCAKVPVFVVQPPVPMLVGRATPQDALVCVGSYRAVAAEPDSEGLGLKTGAAAKAARRGSVGSYSRPEVSTAGFAYC